MTHRRWRTSAVALAVALVLGGATSQAAGGVTVQDSPSPTASTSGPAPDSAQAIPIWAYYYIWFDPSSWNRAKSDTPLIGTYTSDERSVMRQHIEQAMAAGIDGFLVSWKDTSVLSGRLARLAEIAGELHFHLGVVYEGLTFTRHPVETRQVCADLATFASTYATNPVFQLHGSKPIVIWTGTDAFSHDDLSSCVTPVRDRLTMLASARSVQEWQRVSDVFAGNAYYWASVNPEKSWYPTRLAQMGQAVHASGGLWVAPAAPGYDGRLLGGQDVVPRNGGRTLTLELQAAAQSSPDAIGLISWNEFSENSHVEPSRRYGSTALQTLAQFTGSGDTVPTMDSSAPPPRPTAAGFNGVLSFLLMGVILGGLLIWSRWRREPVAVDRDTAPGGHDPTDPGDSGGVDTAAPPPRDRPSAGLHRPGRRPSTGLPPSNGSGSNGAGPGGGA